MILTGAGATMIAITILITDIATTILIMDITITTLTDTIITILTDTITIILIMGITTIIIHLIAMIGKIITITTKTLTEIPLANTHLPMAEEGIAAVMTIVITKIMVPIVLMGIIITTLTITLPALITKETLVVMTIPQEVAIAITTITIIVIIVAIIAIIIRLALTMKVVATTMVVEMMADIRELKEIIKQKY